MNWMPLVLIFGGVSLVLMLLILIARRVVGTRSRMVASEIESTLADTFVFVNRQQLTLWSLSGFVALPLGAYLLTGSILLAAVALIAAPLVPRRVLASMRRRRTRQIERQLPDVLLMIASALRAGSSFMVALEGVVAESPPPIAQELDLLVRELRLGIDLNVALHNTERRIPVQDFLMVTAAISISREVSGNLAEALESVARTLGAKLQMEGKIHALTSQGRMQGIVMTLLPVGLMLILNAMEPDAMAPLFSEKIGWATLAVIAVMEWIGYKAISRITNIDV